MLLPWYCWPWYFDGSPERALKSGTIETDGEDCEVWHFRHHRRGPLRFQECRTPGCLIGRNVTGFCGVKSEMFKYSQKHKYNTEFCGHTCLGSEFPQIEDELVSWLLAIVAFSVDSKNEHAMVKLIQLVYSSPKKNLDSRVASSGYIYRPHTKTYKKNIPIHKILHDHHDSAAFSLLSMVTSPCLHRAFAVPSHPTKERIKEFEAAAERSKDLSNYVNRYPWWHGIGSPKCNPCNLIMEHLNFLNLSQTLEKKHENHWTSPDILEFFNSMPGVAQFNYKEHKAKSKKARMEWREWREHQNLSRMIILCFSEYGTCHLPKGFLLENVRLTPQGHASACCLIRVCLKMGYTPKNLNLLIIYIDLWSFDQLTVPFLYIFMASPHLSHPSWCNYLLSRSTPTSSLRCQWCSAGRMDTASYRHTWKNRGHLRCCETLADPKVGTKSSS